MVLRYGKGLKMLLRTISECEVKQNTVKNIYINFIFFLDQYEFKIFLYDKFQ